LIDTPLGDVETVLSRNTGVLEQFRLVGTGDPSNEDCGSIRFMLFCKNNHSSPDHSGKGKAYHNRCDDWDCPICYPYIARVKSKKMGHKLFYVADMVSGALESVLYGGEKPGPYLERYGYDKMRPWEVDIHHFEFSLDPSRYKNADGVYWSLNEFQDMFKKDILKGSYGPRGDKKPFVIGFGGVYVTHMHRASKEITEEYKIQLAKGFTELKKWDWLRDTGRDHYPNIYYSPHFHVVAVGRVEKSNIFYEETGKKWTYKTLRDGARLETLEDVQGVIAYALNHGVISTQKTVYDRVITKKVDGVEIDVVKTVERSQGCSYGWFGSMSNHAVKFVGVTKGEREFIRCDVCEGFLVKVTLDQLRYALPVHLDDGFDLMSRFKKEYHWAFKQKLLKGEVVDPGINDPDELPVYVSDYMDGVTERFDSTTDYVKFVPSNIDGGGV